MNNRKTTTDFHISLKLKTAERGLQREESRYLSTLNSKAINTIQKVNIKRRDFQKNKSEGDLLLAQFY